MALLSPAENRIAGAIAGIGYCNPFLPDRLELERQALGDAFVEVGSVIWARPGVPIERLFPNVLLLRRRAETLVEEMRSRLVQGQSASEEELLLYEDLALYLLYSHHMSAFDGLVMRDREGDPVGFWKEFQGEFERLLRIPGRRLPSAHNPAVIFAGFYQIERAFAHIFQKIIGGSMPAARLRAAAWDSIFTRDMRRYTRFLHDRMAPITTLITGPSGSGKELVAQAIGRSRYLAFDEESRRFNRSDYTPLNLSAFSPTLIESELFGHVKGAFSGAIDRKGWLEQCSGPDDTVFLDEIGELAEAIQVKLLRVLQDRRFVRVGETTTRPREFHGKIIAATNRDLSAAMRDGRFREDFFHRLCDDHITTPSLADQLADPDRRSQELTELVRFLASELLGELSPGPDGSSEAERLALEADALTREVVDWIEKNLRDYSWPGNVRELSRCVRNVMVRGSYRPPLPTAQAGNRGPVEQYLDQVREASLSSDDLVGRYFAMAYHRTGANYKEAGRRLGVDWRVVRSRLDRAFLDQIRSRADQ
ncbi:sigma 54-interacting transcriptional regulator [Tautonia marina]|uniref:sigma 54-interacting transcriptional regulator n=1 Tax=Tautonia marina TaxID=2653855 RepID=UPI001260F481|nr:sigma 54-interacting transcriptional regulator [Tautonia marina]